MEQESITRRTFVRRSANASLLSATLGSAALARKTSADCSGTSLCVWFYKLWRYHVVTGQPGNLNFEERIKFKVKYKNETGAEITGDVKWGGVTKNFTLAETTEDTISAAVDFSFGAGGKVEIKATSGSLTAEDSKDNITFNSIIGSDDDNSDGIAQDGEWQLT